MKRNNAAIDEWAVLQLHGGGYLSPFRNPYRTLAGLYSEAARGATVVSVDYRVAPENPYPAAVDDALAAYLWILQAGYLPEKVIFGGRLGEYKYYDMDQVIAVALAKAKEL